jgi:hypothetical protein
MPWQTVWLSDTVTLSLSVRMGTVAPAGGGLLRACRLYSNSVFDVDLLGA